jgi:hypothetical protein
VTRWLLDYKKQNPKTNSLELGQALAEHLSKDRSREQVALTPPGDQLESLSLSRPDKIYRRMLSMFGDLRQQLTQLSLEERVQTKVQEYFRRPA